MDFDFEENTLGSAASREGPSSSQTAVGEPIPEFDMSFQHDGSKKPTRGILKRRTSNAKDGATSHEPVQNGDGKGSPLGTAAETKKVGFPTPTIPMVLAHLTQLAEIRFSRSSFGMTMNLSR